MRIAIHQPNYVPWCGYFAKMKACDVFVFLDDAQMPIGRGGYVYRAQIRGESGPMWLTVPVRRHGTEAIATVEPAEPDWQATHLRKLQNQYRKAPFYRAVMELIGPVYAQPSAKLAEFNVRFIRAVAAYLGVEPRFEISSLLGPEGLSDDRLISLVRILGGDTYVSGKGGANYQDPAKFEAAGISLEVRAYAPVPYPQVHGDFIPGLSILDALFNVGSEAANLLHYAGAR
jgi:hypothetical protein